MPVSALIVPCPSCGQALAGGGDGCQAEFESHLARDFRDARFFACHRTLVDAYCLQHPSRYCASTKSLAAHLCSLAVAIDRGTACSGGPAALQRWLSGTVTIAKPPLPTTFGALTIASLRGETEPARHGENVMRWAAAVWTAYTPLHGIARQWLAASGTEHSG
jgi:hypothetical protein